MKALFLATGMAVSLTFAALAPSRALAQAGAQGGSSAVGPPRGPIEIVVWNIRKSLGHVRVAICTKLTFADAHKSCPYHGEAPAQAGATTVVVPDVPAGTFAVQVFQDEQDLHAIRRGPLGVPLEGVGFSNDAPVPLGPPRFKDAAFDYDPAAPLSLSIKLRYFPNL
jgi:uncharacterized protein (DUF2141 family)